MQIVKCKLNISVHCFTDASLVFNLSAPAGWLWPQRWYTEGDGVFSNAVPTFVGSDFPSLKGANSDARAEYPGFILYRGFLNFSQYLFFKKKKPRIFSVSMEMLECYLPQRYMTRVLIYIFPNDCHFWPETLTTGTTMTHSKCQCETT